MSFLLDTNILSELRKPSPAGKLLNWFERVDDHSLFISALTLGEIQNGISILPEGQKKENLTIWFEKVKVTFSNRTFPVSPEIALKWGELSASCRLKGRTLPAVDGIIGATAHVTGSILVTRNTADFEGLGIRLMNPWITD